MKTTTLLILLSSAPIAPVFAAGTNVFSSDVARIGYAMGVTFANRWKELGLQVDGDSMLRGLKDAQSGGPKLMTPQQVHDTINEFQQKATARQEQMRVEMAEKNKTDGEAFLAQNKTKPGVLSFPDGLQYKVIVEGDGPVPGPGDTVRANYRGTFIDGKEFDNSARAGAPVPLPIPKLFAGWQEALTHMKVGSKWRLFVPADLAYGSVGRAPYIAPNSVLIVETELVSIDSPEPPPAPVISTNPPLTSDIIKVPSLSEMKKGAKIEVIKADDVGKYQSPTSSPARSPK